MCIALAVKSTPLIPISVRRRVMYRRPIASALPLTASASLARFGEKGRGLLFIRHCNGMWKPWKSERLPFSFLESQCFPVCRRFRALDFRLLVLAALPVCGWTRIPE